jgi:hypothetical protein
VLVLARRVRGIDGHSTNGVERAVLPFHVTASTLTRSGARRNVFEDNRPVSPPRRSRLLEAVLLAAVACGCARAAGADAAAPETPRSLRSSRRLRFVLLRPVAVTAAREAAWAADLGDELPAAVLRRLREAGFSVEQTPRYPHDAELALAVAVDGAGAVPRARAVMRASAGARRLDELAAAERAAPPAELADALARELVLGLARSAGVSAFADETYGARLRPLADTVGRHATGREPETAPPSDTGPNDAPGR